MRGTITTGTTTAHSSPPVQVVNAPFKVGEARERAREGGREGEGERGREGGREEKERAAPPPALPPPLATRSFKWAMLRSRWAEAKREGEGARRGESGGESGGVEERGSRERRILMSMQGSPAAGTLAMIGRMYQMECKFSPLSPVYVVLNYQKEGEEEGGMSGGREREGGMSWRRMKKATKVLTNIFRILQACG